MFQELANWLIDPAGLTPHGFCLLWEPGLIWTYAVSDAGIAVAYFTIPLALAAFARRRRDLVFRPIFWLFAAFILLCGSTHLLDVVTLWVPAYGLQAIAKAATAAISIATATALWLILPKALALPSPKQYEQANLALRESEERYRASFEHSPVPMQILTEGGIVTAVSRSWLRLFDYPEDAVIGRHITDFHPPGSEGWVESDLATLRDSDEVRDLERRYLRHDGTVLDMHRYRLARAQRTPTRRRRPRPQAGSACAAHHWICRGGHGRRGPSARDGGSAQAVYVRQAD
jgi:PAS domain S-box-containing protein